MIFLTALTTGFKKDPSTSIRKLEMKVYKKTVRMAIARDLSLNHNPFDYVLWGVLENQTNAIRYKIGSLKIPIEKDGNKMAVELILKACKPLKSHGDTII